MNCNGHNHPVSYRVTRTSDNKANLMQALDASGNVMYWGIYSSANAANRSGELYVMCEPANGWVPCPAYDPANLAAAESLARCTGSRSATVNGVTWNRN